MSLAVNAGEGVSREVVELESETIMKTYARLPVQFVRGEGCRLWDVNGRAYLDCLAGIAVVGVGHCRPEVTAAVSRQMAKLVHVSNLFYTESQVRLASRIRALTGWGRVFFSNSGAEANECALKLARVHAKAAGRNSASILSLQGSFHGRTMGALALTGQPEKHRGFEPMLQGVRHLPVNDIRALEEAIEGTAALFVEGIQGEGGVIPVDPDYLRYARELCDRSGCLLVFDEVQTGLCRTGKYLSFQHVGIEPDIFTLGKALGNGLPIGATVARDDVADHFEPGTHGTTMGGGPVVCEAALAVLDIMERESLCEAAQLKGRQLHDGIAAIEGVTDVRGSGLLLAAELACDANVVVRKALEVGLVINAVTPHAVRLTPPLTISAEEIVEATEKLGHAIAGAKE